MESIDKKVMADLKKLYENEPWTEEERRGHIQTAYNYVMKQRAAQAKYGTVDANDTEAVQAVAERRKNAQAGLSQTEEPTGTSAASALRQYDASARAAASVSDRATQNAVNEVKAATEKAVDEYQAQRNAVAAQAVNDADASALYSELRGDKGGIGKAQYDSINNLAAKNQAEINRAQTELVRNAAVEIARLQAEGEYEKAEKLLDVAQERLSALLEMTKWQAEYAADEQELQAKLSQWQAEYELSVAKVSGYTANGEATGDTRAKLAALGEAMLKKGLMPNAAQLSAMGMTEEQARTYLNSLKSNR